MVKKRQKRVIDCERHKRLMSTENADTTMRAQKKQKRQHEEVERDNMGLYLVRTESLCCRAESTTCRVGEVSGTDTAPTWIAW